MTFADWLTLFTVVGSVLALILSIIVLRRLEKQR